MALEHYADQIEQYYEERPFERFRMLDTLASSLDVRLDKNGNKLIDAINACENALRQMLSSHKATETDTQPSQQELLESLSQTVAALHMIVNRSCQIVDASGMPDDIVASIWHELKTPTTPLKGYTDLLKVVESDETKDQLIYFAISACVHLRRLLTNIGLATVGQADRFGSQYRRPPMGRIEVVRLASASAREIRHHESTKRMSVNARGKRLRWEELADPNGARYVLEELMGNAMEFSADGSQILLRIEHLPTAEVRLSMLNIVEPEYVDRDPSNWFLPFTKTTPDSTREAGEVMHDGLGIGLLAARRLIGAKHGTMEVDIQPVVGSRQKRVEISFTWPRSEQAGFKGKRRNEAELAESLEYNPQFVIARIEQAQRSVAALAPGLADWSADQPGEVRAAKVESYLGRLSDLGACYSLLGEQVKALLRRKVVHDEDETARNIRQGLIRHELLTPLTSIIGFLRMMERASSKLATEENPEQQQKLIQRLEGNIGIIEQSNARYIRSLSKFYSVIGDTSTANIVRQLETQVLDHPQSIRELALSARQRVAMMLNSDEEVDQRLIAEKPLGIDWDRMRQDDELRFVLEELVGNALKFAADKTSVDINVRQRGRGCRVVITNRLPSQHETDYIPDVARGRLLKLGQVGNWDTPFRQSFAGWSLDTRKHLGLGVGLKVVQDMVDRVDGAALAFLFSSDTVTTVLTWPRQQEAD